MFAAQLRYLRNQGFSGLTFGELCQRRPSGQPLPARPIVLTFDDGYADLIEEALPIMIEQGFPATVFVTTGWLRGAARLCGRDATRPDAFLGSTGRAFIGRGRGRRTQSQSLRRPAVHRAGPPSTHLNSTKPHPDDRKDNPTRAVEPGRTR
jgi:peptidoglycan/xylan/chitin deacetylase (PgdA/CDA1 family)